MQGSIRILGRFIGATVLISVFLLIFNFVLLAVLIFNGMNEGGYPGAVVQQVAEGLQRRGEQFSLVDDAKATLVKNQAWALLIDEDGTVLWAYQAPDELPNHFSLVDVAKFTRWYLQDYPVFTHEHEDGLVVIGYPENRFAKYHFHFPPQWVGALPMRVLSLLVVNMGLALILSLLIGYRLVRSIRPLMEGIQALGEDREVLVEPKGILADLAKSINRVSQLLQQKNQRLKERDEARSNWIAGISHDIRTPLSMILGYSSAWEENRELPLELRKEAGIVRRQAEKLRGLVNDLNLVSMLEYEMQPLQRRPLRLAALLRQVATDFLNNGLPERFKLQIEKVDERAIVAGDERLLKRAITNLIQNSIDHNPAGCTISLQITVQEDAGVCRLMVTDNGKGIPRDMIKDLMELPYSRKRKRPRANGHGFGLPMVARIASAHQGQFRLKSDVGEGVQAEIVLPCSDKGSSFGANR
ncbi:MAG: HAMP domain-containing sensor histidine kinase [Caldibacillus sp.]